MAILRPNESEVYTKCIYTMTLNLQTGQLLDIKVDMVVTCQAELTHGAHMASSIGASIMSPIMPSSTAPPTAARPLRFSIVLHMFLTKIQNTNPEHPEML